MRKISISLTVCLAGICFLVTPANSFESGLTETDGAIRTWRSAEGLPADSVTAIIQTRDGFLWVGTSAGLVRFDGVKFTEVKLTQVPTSSSIRVTALCEDGQGRLWIGSQEGLFQLEQGKARRFSKTNGLLDDSVTSLAADTKGQVWIGTKSGLNVSTGKEFQSFTMRDGLPDELVSGVHVARSGTVWITTRGGMCRFIDGKISVYALQTESQGRSPEYLGAYEDRSGNVWAYGDTYFINVADASKRFNYFRGNEATSVRIWSLCEGRDGRLWIGTSGRGLFCFDDNRFQPVILGELRWPYDVRAICEDHEGNLWLGTSGGGLVQLRPQPVHVMRTGQGLPASSPTALALDAGGRVHVGLQRGGLFVGEGSRFERFGNTGGFDVQDSVSSICMARDGTVWAGTLGGGLYGLRNGRGIRFTTANGLAEDVVLSVCVDKEGSVWASTSAGTVHRFTKTNTTRFDGIHGLPVTPVTVLLPAAGGGIWLGTEGGSVLRGEKGKFTVVQSADTLRHRPVLALYEGEEEQLWVGSTGGLTCLMRGAITSWNTGNGLPNDYVAGIVEDTAKNIWLATGGGIYRVTRSAIQKSIADSQTPLVCKLMSDAKTTSESATISGGARALLSIEGKLWFATSEGVLNVDTRRPEVELAPLPLYIESIAFNNEPPFSMLRGLVWSAAATNKTEVTAPGDLRSLDVRFTALSFTAPEKTRFRHKLDGVDADWVEVGTSRSAKYSRLAYGHYRFHVAARAADGPWQEAANVFAFEVPTPLYLQPWAIMSYGIAAIALVAGIVRVVSHRRLRFALAQLEQQQSLERERMRIARDMHDEIGSKLTKISFLSEHARMDAKMDGPLTGKIQSIAETSRELLQTMDEIVWVVNPRNDTLEHLTAYLSHYADEYFQNTSVECELRLPQTISHFPLSSEARHNLFLAFEETLNNVLKHSGAKKVKVEMVVNAPKFEIIVTDNGCGFAATGKPVVPGSPAAGPRGGRGGNGLRNIRQRLAEIGGECSIRSQPGAGTTVSLSIRLNKNSTNKL